MQSLERGLAVIRAFDAEHRDLTLSEVARATGLTRAAARRFLLTLVELGYVHAAGGRFSLRPRVLELGFAYLSSLSLPEVAQPHMEELVATINESSSISVLDVTEIVYVARVPTRRIMSITLAVGTRLPAYATSMGRVLLSDLPPPQLREFLSTARIERNTEKSITNRNELAAEITRVAQAGFAIVDEELEIGLRSIAVPVRDRSRKVVAAINVSTQSSRFTTAEMEREILPHLLAAARSIEDFFVVQ